MQKATEMKRRMDAPNQDLWNGMKGRKDCFPWSQGEVGGENENECNSSSLSTH